MPDWFGALAQLGERFAGSEEVRSSILLGSTKPPTKLDNFSIYRLSVHCASVCGCYESRCEPVGITLTNWMLLG